MQNKKEILKIFSENLRKIRIKNNYTQMQVCVHTEIDRSLYQKYESSNPPDIRLTTLVKILDFYKIKLEDLLK